MQRRGRLGIYALTSGMAPAVLGLGGLLSLFMWTGDVQAAPGLAGLKGLSQETAAVSALPVKRGGDKKRCVRDAQNTCMKVVPPKPRPAPLPQ
jgi:hypothetical protein